MRNIKRAIEQYLEKNKIARYLFLVLMAIFSILLMILLFSWDSLLFWIIDGEETDFHSFIFWAIAAVVIIIISIMISIINRKKK